MREPLGRPIHVPISDVAEVIESLANVQAMATLSAGAHVDHGVRVIVTGNHRNRAAGSGCHDAACSAPVTSLSKGHASTDSPSESKNIIVALPHSRPEKVADLYRAHNFFADSCPVTPPNFVFKIISKSASDFKRFMPKRLSSSSVSRSSPTRSATRCHSIEPRSTPFFTLTTPSSVFPAPWKGSIGFERSDKAEVPQDTKIVGIKIVGISMKRIVLILAEQILLVAARKVISGGG